MAREPLLDNRPRVVAGVMHRAVPCCLCKTHDGVVLEWAVPLDEGGERTPWNVSPLCLPCRRWRADTQTAALRSTTSSELKRRMRARPPGHVKGGDWVHCANCGDGFAVPRPKDRVRVDGGRGGLVCPTCSVWRNIGKPEAEE